MDSADRQRIQVALRGDRGDGTAMSRSIWLLVVAGCGAHAAAPPPAEHHAAMDHRFDNAEQWAKSFDDPARDAWQQPDRVIAALELGPAMVIADIGAGTGYFAVRLARAVPGRAQREGLSNLRAVLTPPTDPQLAAASIDRILVVDVWHHIDDRAGYARKLA